MKHIKYNIILIILINLFVSNAQFVKVRDANFLKKISQMYPDILSSDSLSIDTTKAALITGLVNFSASNINDAFEVKYFKKVKLLQLQANNISHMPDFSKLSLLTILDIRQNPWTNMEQLEPIKKQLKTLLVRGKSGIRHKDFTFLNSYSNLTRLEITNYSAEILPDFTNYSGLTEVSVYNNKLTFSELSKLVTIPNADTVVNAFPQLNLTTDTVISVFLNKSYTLSIPIDTNVNSSIITYDFYRNGSLVQSSTSHNLKIDSFLISDTGKYVVKISSSEPLFAGKYLSTGTFRLTTNTCNLISSIDFQITESCNLTPFLITSIDKQTNFPCSNLKLIESTKGHFFDLTLGTQILIPTGNYNLYIKDTNMCETTKNNFIEISNSKDCDMLFSPNGDGIADYFFINGSEWTQIRNKTGQLIREFQAPFYWDGTDKNGIPVEIGIYIIETESINQRLKVSVLR